MRKQFAYPMTLAAAVLVLDLATKFWVESSISRFETIEVIPGFFNLVHVLNLGAAFGFLNDGGISWQRPFFIGVAVLATSVIIYLLRSGYTRDWLGVTGLGMILGGALGNLVDRVRIGAVVDFLDFYVGEWHWPAFNVADIGISCGVCALLVSFYISERRLRRRAPKGRTEEK